MLFVMGDKIIHYCTVISDLTSLAGPGCNSRCHKTTCCLHYKIGSPERGPSYSSCCPCDGSGRWPIRTAWYWPC